MARRVIRLPQANPGPDRPSPGAGDLPVDSTLEPTSTPGNASPSAESPDPAAENRSEPDEPGPADLASPPDAEGPQSADALIKKGLKKGYLFPILPEHKVYLYAPEKDGERFARLFQDTWRELDLESQQEILEHWKNGDSGTFVASDEVFKPRIQLVPDYEGRGEAQASTRLNGHHLLFWSIPVHLMPDELVQDLIAHELAHVLQGAEGWLFRNSFEDLEELEEIANDWVEGWGFSAYAIDDWMAEHKDEIEAAVKASEAKADEELRSQGNDPIAIQKGWAKFVELQNQGLDPAEVLDQATKFMEEQKQAGQK